jgi:hypothetical protein
MLALQEEGAYRAGRDDGAIRHGRG